MWTRPSRARRCQRSSRSHWEPWRTPPRRAAHVNPRRGGRLMSTPSGQPPRALQTRRGSRRRCSPITACVRHQKHTPQHVSTAHHFSADNPARTADEARVTSALQLITACVVDSSCSLEGQVVPEDEHDDEKDDDLFGLQVGLAFGFLILTIIGSYLPLSFCRSRHYSVRPRGKFFGVFVCFVASWCRPSSAPTRRCRSAARATTPCTPAARPSAFMFVP